MGLAAELKDFMTGFQSGKSMLSLTESEYKIQKDQEELKDRKGALDLGEAQSDARSANGNGSPYTFDSNDPGEIGRSPGAGGSPAFASRSSGGGVNTLPAFAREGGADMSGIVARHINTESGGRYDALGPVIRRRTGNDRAYGKYQVMGANIPEWTERHVGRRMTPREFLADQEAQDKVYNGEMAANVRKYGNMKDALSVWHSGVPLRTALAQRRHDGNMSTGDYVRKIAGASYARGGLVLDEEELLRQENAVGVPMAPVLRIDASADDPMYTTAPLPAPATETGQWSEPMVLPEEGRRIDPSVTEEVTAPDATRRVAPSLTEGATSPETTRRVAPSISDAVPAEEALTIGPPEAVKARRGALEITPVEPGADRPKGTFEPNPDTTAEAIGRGLKRISREVSSDAAIPEADPTRITKVSSFARGEDAATPQEVRAIDQTIDPEGRMDRDRRAMARIEAGYRFYLERGEPEKAEKWAASLLMYTRTAAQTAGAIARQQLQAGNYKGAATTIQRGYSEIPDGSTLHIDKVGPDGKVDYRLVDKYGDYTKRGEATVNQMYNLATGMENGSEWLKQMQISAMPMKDRIELRRSDEDRAAVQGYNRVASDDFLNGMSPEEFRAYNAMSPKDQNAYRTNEEQRRQFDLQGQRLDADLSQRRLQAERQAEAAARAERALELREKTAEERAEFFRKRDELREQKAQDTQEYSGLKDTYLDARRNLDNIRRDTPYDREAIASAQAELDAAEGAITDWAKEGQGRDAYIRQLPRARVNSGGTGVGGAGGGGTGRDTSGARSGTEGRVRELSRQRDEMTYNFTKSPPADPAERKKAETALALKNAEVEFTRNQRPYREYEEEVGQAVAAAFGAGTDLDNLTAEQKALRPRIEAAVGGVLAANRDVSAGTAADLVALARAGNGIRFTEDGRVQVGNARPLYMSPPAVIALGQMAKEAQKAKQEKEAGSRPAARTTPRRPATAEERAAGDEALGRITRRPAATGEGPQIGTSRSSIRNAAERERLRQQLGPEYMEDLPLSELRRRARMLQGPADASVGGIPF